MTPSKYKALLALLEFMTILLVLPIKDVQLIVGGPAGLALLITLHNLLRNDGRPTQGPRNDQNLN